jgi:hypothetical protein
LLDLVDLVFDYPVLGLVDLLDLVKTGTGFSSLTGGVLLTFYILPAFASSEAPIKELSPVAYLDNTLAPPRIRKLISPSGFFTMFFFTFLFIES